MAERTQAEMLADLERALARQDADRELFERPAPVEREFAYGIPGVQEEGTLPSQLLSYLIPARTEVLQPPVTEFGEPRTQLNPRTNQLEEIVDRTVTPGVYGKTEFGFGYTPIVRGIGSLIDYGQELIGSPEARSEAADAVSRLPEQMKRQLYGGKDAFERGRMETVDLETGETFSGIEPLFAATAPLGVGRVATGAPPGTSLGILGGGGGKSGKKIEQAVEKLEKQNLTQQQAWDAQAGSNLKGFRSTADGLVRYEIPMQNARLRTATVAEDDPNKPGFIRSILDKYDEYRRTGDDKRLRGQLGLRVIPSTPMLQTRGRRADRFGIPDEFGENEKTLNKLGYSRKDPFIRGDFKPVPDLFLEDILDFPELFSEYPALAKIKVERQNPLSGLFVRGSYNPETNTIGIAQVPNTVEGRQAFMSTLMHEIQHAVQHLEGRTSGANPNQFLPADYESRRKAHRENSRELQDELQKDFDELGIVDAGLRVDEKKIEKFGDFKLPEKSPDFEGSEEYAQVAKKIDVLEDNIVTYLERRSKEVMEMARGIEPPVIALRRRLEKQENSLRKKMEGQGKGPKEIRAAINDLRASSIMLGGSDKALFEMNRALEDLGFPEPEKFTTRIKSMLDERLPKFVDLVKTKQGFDAEVSEAERKYKVQFGEVEARSAQRRFEDPSLSTNVPESTMRAEILAADDTLEFPDADGLPEAYVATQQFRMPDDALPSETLALSIDDPNNPQMELPGMGPSKPLPKDPAKRLLAKRDNLRGSLDQDAFPNARARNAVARRLAKTERDIRELRAAAGYPTDRDYAQGGEVNQMRKPVISSGLSGLLRGYTQGPLARVSRETQEPVGMFRGGGMGRSVPELDFSNVQVDPSALPAYALPAQAAEALAAQQAAQATPAAAPAMPTTQDLIAQQRALEQAAAFQNPEGLPEQTIYGTSPDQTFTPGMYLQEGSDVLISPTGPATTPFDTSQLVTAPGQTPDEPGMLGGGVTTVDTTPVDTAPVDTAPVDTTPVQTTPVDTAPVQTTPVQTTPVQTTPVNTTPVSTQPTGPVYLPPTETDPVQAGPTAAEVLAAEQAARDLAAAEEAERLRIAQEEADRVAAEQEAIRIANEQAAAELLAQQEAARIAQEQAAAEEAQRLAAETLAAQQAAAQAEETRLAEEEAQRIAAEQAAADAAAAQALADEQAALEALAQRQAAEDAAALAAEEEARAAAEAERIAAAQLAAEQLAAQEAAQMAADQEAAAQLQRAEQLAAQQEADRLAMEAQLAATPDPDPIYDAPTQGELLQAAETAQAATGDLFTTPSQTGTAIDRSMYGQVVDPVTTTTTTADPATTAPAQQDPMQQNQTPAVITEASDGTLHPTPAAAAAYEQQLAAKQQAQQRAQESAQNFAGIQSLLGKVDLDVADSITPYTSGYPSSQGMEIKRTYMPFEGTEEERATGYTMPIYKPVAQQSMPSLFRTRDVTSGVNTDAFTAGSAAPGPDSGIVNTGVQGTAPGTFGLESNEMYQCPNGYVLSFENGNPICNLVGGGGPGKKRQVPPEVIDITGGMRYGGEVGLNRGIGSFGA